MTEQEVLHQAIRSTTDPMAVMDRIVAQSLALVPTADGASLEVRRDVDTLEYLSAAGTLAGFVGLRLPMHQSLSGRAVITGEVELCDDTRTDERVNHDAVERTGIRSMLCVPLSQDSGGVAVLKVSSVRTAAFTSVDVERLGILAEFLSTTLTAASQIAAVTTDLLSHLEELGAAGAFPDTSEQTARFVANVMTPGLADRVQAASLVRDVLVSDSFEIVLQPIVDLATRRVVSSEALARFSGPVARPPDWWFAAAHSVGLGVALEERALLKALDVFEHVPDHIRMSVNVGVDLLLEPHFTDLFDGHPVDRLTLELTEHEAVTDYGAVLAVTRGLRERGARLSVDDTGSGYSGLTHILRLRPNDIKLDRELVSDLHLDPAKRALATALIHFAASIDARVVAEGIEQLAEADCLIELGADYGQGFLYSHPLPPDQLALVGADST